MSESKKQTNLNNYDRQKCRAQLKQILNKRKKTLTMSTKEYVKIEKATMKSVQQIEYEHYEKYL